MALQLGDLRDALLDAGASPAKADKAASEVAAYESRLGGVESAMAGLKGEMVALKAAMAGLSGRVSILTWAIGLNVALTLAVLARILAH